MESEWPCTLPKGLFINANDVHDELASYSILPPEKLWEYWHIYTTTFKKTNDPTSRRLENFWWQLIGSDRRFLNGNMIARLYKSISTGTTEIVVNDPATAQPLTTPAVQPVDAVGAGSSKERAVDSPHNTTTQARSEENPQAENPSTEVQVEDDTAQISASTTPPKALPPSALRPTPGPSILKDPHRPRPSEPRPKIRFLLPSDTESEEEMPPSKEIASKTSEAPPHASVSAKKPSGQLETLSSQSFIIPAAEAKRRALSQKRNPPQPAPTSRTSGSSSQPSRSDSNLRSVPPIKRLAAQRTNGRAEGEKRRSGAQKAPAMSEKARGKQSVCNLKTIVEADERDKNPTSREPVMPQGVNKRPSLANVETGPTLQKMKQRAMMSEPRMMDRDDYIKMVAQASKVRNTTASTQYQDSKQRENEVKIRSHKAVRDLPAYVKSANAWDVPGYLEPAYGWGCPVLGGMVKPIPPFNQPVFVKRLPQPTPPTLPLARRSATMKEPRVSRSVLTKQLKVLASGGIGITQRGHTPFNGLFSKETAAFYPVDVEAKILDQSGSAEVPPSTIDPPKPIHHREDPKPPKSLWSYFWPTAPSKAEIIHLAQARSSLMILLDRKPGTRSPF